MVVVAFFSDAFIVGYHKSLPFYSSADIPKGHSRRKLTMDYWNTHSISGTVPTPDSIKEEFSLWLYRGINNLPPNKDAVPF